MYAVVFPGQGSQHPGMGLDLYQNSPAAKAVFEEAGQATGIDLPHLMFETPEEVLRETQNAQLALYVVGLAAWRALREEVSVEPAAFAGHSLGEYTAIVAAGVLPIGEGARLVRRRGELMATVGRSRPGTMAAVLGMDGPEIDVICREVEACGEVVVANDNSPGQVVISGDLDAVQSASATLLERGARRVVPLNVSGAFHSPLMEEAATQLGEALRAAPFGQTPQKTPVYANVSAEKVTDPMDWPSLLEHQMSRPVRWTESIRAMVESGIDRFVECGSGEVLSKLVKRIEKAVECFRVVDMATLAQTTALLKEARG
ncbi:MAG: ACP S-malonyltransferase [Fimbriimonadaceae bacterium]|nr:ACP S-malonyltransferase [Fimbriimonadaceae bacterium]QYK55935.1 MAG: ACP S-malonyltransferase [Fimbriimonadaceae bacterium]